MGFPRLCKEEEEEALTERKTAEGDRGRHLTLSSGLLMSTQVHASTHACAHPSSTAVKICHSYSFDEMLIGQ